MPSSDTFDCKPLGDFVQKYLQNASCSVDPFARNKKWATYTNDLNPKTEAQYHMDAEAFLVMLKEQGVKADLVIMDPPYSPRQISEQYKEAGITAGMKDTQNAVLYSRVRAAAFELLKPTSTVLSFGWSTNGMGKKYGMEIDEILLVCHGGAHNDTIAIAESFPSK